MWCQADVFVGEREYDKAEIILEKLMRESSSNAILARSEYELGKVFLAKSQANYDSDYLKAMDYYENAMVMHDVQGGLDGTIVEDIKYALEDVVSSAKEGYVGGVDFDYLKYLQFDNYQFYLMVNRLKGDLVYVYNSL